MTDLPTLMRRYRGATAKNPVGKLSQAQAAEAVGVAVRNWQNWEIGHRKPRGLALEALLTKLGSK